VLGIAPGINRIFLIEDRDKCSRQFFELDLGNQSSLFTTSSHFSLKSLGKSKSTTRVSLDFELQFLSQQYYISHFKQTELLYSSCISTETESTQLVSYVKKINIHEIQI